MTDALGQLPAVSDAMDTNPAHSHQDVVSEDVRHQSPSHSRPEAAASGGSGPSNRISPENSAHGSGDAEGSSAAAVSPGIAAAAASVASDLQQPAPAAHSQQFDNDSSSSVSANDEADVISRDAEATESDDGLRTALEHASTTPTPQATKPTNQGVAIKIKLRPLSAAAAPTLEEPTPTPTAAETPSCTVVKPKRNRHKAREVPIDVVAARQLAIRRRHGTAPPKDSPWANDVCMSGVNVLAKRSSGSVWRSC